MDLKIEKDYTDRLEYPNYSMNKYTLKQIWEFLTLLEEHEEYEETILSKLIDLIETKLYYQ